MAIDIPSPENVPSPEKSLTQNLFNEFILESSREQSEWISEMLAFSLESTLHTHENKLDRATHLYRVLSSPDSATTNRHTTRALKGIAAASANKHIENQISSLRSNNTPNELALMVKEATQKAWELRAAPGWEEGRTEFMNRMVLASFIKFLVNKGHTEIGLVTGDMDGLKAFNTEDSKLGDCGLLTVFYGADAAITENGGMLFIPNQLGGDDIVGIFLGKSEEELRNIAAGMNAKIQAEVPNIRKYAESDTIFGQPLRFSMTGESKRLDLEKIVSIEQKHGGKLIGPPRITTTSTIVSLEDSSSAVGKFFTIFSDLHAKIDHLKEQAKNDDPNNERGNITSFLLGEAPPFPAQS